MNKRWIAMMPNGDVRYLRSDGQRFFCLLVMLALGFGMVAQAWAAPPYGGPPPAVTVATVKEEEVNPPSEYVGRMEAIQAVDLRARVDGVLERVAFQEGADVNAGDLLYVIEQAPYQARFDQARAVVSEAEAALTKAQQYLKRLKTVKSGGVSATDLDTALSSEQQAMARFQEAQAALELARLNLGYTTIRAAISGRIGRTAFSKGNLVGPTSGALARIVQVDPIRVVYSMSEIDLLQNRMTGESDNQAYFQERLIPRLKMSNGQIYAVEGRLDFIDNQVDPATGTIAVRAEFSNPKGVLLPGQYVTVQVSLKEAKQLPVIPQSAVMEDREGRYVFVLDDHHIVRLRRITTGAAIQTRWAVESGLKAGETIVVQGVQKIGPDQEVTPKTGAETADEPGKE